MPVILGMHGGEWETRITAVRKSMFNTWRVTYEYSRCHPVNSIRSLKQLPETREYCVSMLVSFSCFTESCKTTHGKQKKAEKWSIIWILE
jgi:hypothetical protein